MYIIHYIYTTTTTTTTATTTTTTATATTTTTTTSHSKHTNHHIVHPCLEAGLSVEQLAVGQRLEGVARRPAGLQY